MSVTTELDGLPCPMYVCFQIAVPLDYYIQRWGWPDGKTIYRGYVLLTIDDAVKLIHGPQERPQQTRRPRPSRVSVDYGERPPCIVEIESKIQSGIEVGHFERFLLATWYIRRFGVDKAVQMLVDIFSKSPDYDPKVTEYQIRHISGQAGGRKKYSVPSCSTVVANGACPVGGTCGVKSPYAYGRRGPTKLVVRSYGQAGSS